MKKVRVILSATAFTFAVAAGVFASDAFVKTGYIRQADGTIVTLTDVSDACATTGTICSRTISGVTYQIYRTSAGAQNQTPALLYRQP